MRVIVFDIDGVLLDVRPSFYRVVQELSGATLTDIGRFKANGGFNDDWELTRAATAWIKAGRPELFGQVDGWRAVIDRCGNDPGDLSAQCHALYSEHYWKDEKPLVTSAQLRSLSKRFAVRACTGRSRWELDRAEELLGFTFPLATTSEIVRKPNPQALLRLLPGNATEVWMLGDTEDDRRTVEAATAHTPLPLRYFHVVDSPLPYLRPLLEEA